MADSRKPIDYSKVIKPAKSNFDNELQSNKKLSTFKTPSVGRVNSFTPLAAQKNEQAVRNQGLIANLGASATESVIGKYDDEVANINTHNLNVDRKVLMEEQARKAAEAQARLKAAQWSTSQSGGNPGDKFSMDGIKSSADPSSILGMQYSGPGGGKGTVGQDQANNISAALAIADRRGASDYEKQVMIATMMAESNARNLSGGDRDSAGLFQQRPSQGWGSLAQVTDVNYSTNKFLDALKPNLGKGGSGWMDAQKTQRSAFSDGSNYKVYWSFAQKVVAAQANPVGAAIAGNTKVDQFANKWVGKKPDYDNAYGSQCVDLFRYYVQSLGRKQPSSMALGGGARSLWQSPKNYKEMQNAGFKAVNKDSNGVKGDIAVFGSGLGAGFGHVGVVMKDNGNGTVQVLNSNSSTVGNGKATNVVTISKKHLLGYWR